jgi:four helix bundle protein
MAGVRDHRELDAWKLAREVRTRVRSILARPVFRKDLDLWSQLRRASRSPCSNIAEGFSRYYPRDFARYARTAKGSLSEVIDHLEVALEEGYTTPEETQEIVVLAKRARGATTELILYLETAIPPKPPDRRPRRPRRQHERDENL